MRIVEIHPLFVSGSECYSMLKVMLCFGRRSRYVALLVRVRAATWGSAWFYRFQLLFNLIRNSKQTSPVRRAKSIPLVRRTAMAQSSSCSQMEMKLDCRSIYTKLMRKKQPYIQWQSPPGKKLDEEKRFTWSYGEIWAILSKKRAHQLFWSEAAQIAPKYLLPCMETEKLSYLFLKRSDKHSVKKLEKEKNSPRKSETGWKVVTAGPSLSLLAVRYGDASL